MKSHPNCLHSLDPYRLRERRNMMMIDEEEGEEVEDTKSLKARQHVKQRVTFPSPGGARLA